MIDAVTPLARPDVRDLAQRGATAVDAGQRELRQQLRPVAPLRRQGRHHIDPMVLALHLAQYRSEEHTSELQSLMRISYAVFCLKKKTNERAISRHHLI